MVISPPPPPSSSTTHTIGRKTSVLSKTQRSRLFCTRIAMWAILVPRQSVTSQPKPVLITVPNPSKVHLTLTHTP